MAGRSEVGGLILERGRSQPRRLDGRHANATQSAQEMELDEICERHRKQMSKAVEKEKARRQENDLVPRRLRVSTRLG